MLGKFLWYKYLDRNGNIVKYYKKPSIWIGVKEGISKVSKISQWQLYDGTKEGFGGAIGLGFIRYRRN